jgi:hypothetical protein
MDKFQAECLLEDAVREARDGRCYECQHCGRTAPWWEKAEDIDHQITCDVLRARAVLVDGERVKHKNDDRHVGRVGVVLFTPAGWIAEVKWGGMTSTEDVCDLQVQS